MNRFGRNLMLFAVADICGAMIGLLTSPIMTRLLTPEQYGAVPLMAAAWAILASLQYGGMDSAFPFFRAQGKEPRLSVIGTSTRIAMLSALGLVLIFGAGGLAMPYIRELAQVGSIEFIVFAVGLLPASWIGWQLYLLRFEHRAGYFVVLTLFGRVVGVLAALPLIYLAEQQDRLLVSIAVGAGVAWLAWLFGRRLIQRAGLGRDTTEFSGALGKRLTRYGIALVPGGMLYAFTVIADRLIIGEWGGPSEAAVYVLAVSICSAPLMLKAWFGRVWGPHVVEWIATKDESIYLPKLQRAFDLIALVMFSLAVFGTIWADPVIDLVFPSHYLAAAAIVPWLLLGGALSTLSLVQIATVLIADTPKFHLPIYALGLAVNVAACLVLVPELGPRGAGMATALSEFTIFACWLLLGYVWLANLRLRLSTALVAAALAVVACIGYEAGLIPPDGTILGRLYITLGFGSIISLLVWRNYPAIKLVLASLVSSDSSSSV